MADRYRTKGSFKTDNKSIVYNQWSSCSQSTEEPIILNAYATGEKFIMYDKVVERYYERKRKGEFMMNPLYSEHLIAERRPGSDFRSHTVGTRLCNGVNRQQTVRATSPQVERLYAASLGSSIDLGTETPPIYDLHGSLISDLLVELSTKVRNDRGRADFNVFETLAESDKALGALTGVFTGSAKSAWNFAARKRNKAAGDAATGYAAWRWGFKPLISDVNSVIQG